MTIRLPLAILLLAGLVGCQTETRVVRYNPLLGGLPGSESNTPVVKNFGDYSDPTAIPPDKLVQTDATGKKTLTAKTGRHLMVHIYNALAQNDRQTFVDQILSKMTKEEFAARGLDPATGFEELQRRRDDIVALFNVMPSGEFTPGVFMRPVGKGVQRIEVTGLAANDLTWTGMDMVMEKGNWKLRWFCEPEPSASR